MWSKQAKRDVSMSIRGASEICARGYALTKKFTCQIEQGLPPFRRDVYIKNQNKFKR